MKKFCLKCAEEKDVCEFYFRKDTNKYKNECRSCSKIRQKQYVKNNYVSIMAKNKKYQENNVNKIREIKSRWKRNNPEYIKKENSLRAGKIKEWRSKNREILNKKLVERRKLDINFKIRCNLRSRISAVIRNNIKAGSSIKVLGCSLDYLKEHLKSKFYINQITGNEMAFDNYGEWHIDHIKPLSSFDLSDRKQFLKACHYTNLQPLWAEDNLTKSNKLYWEI